MFARFDPTIRGVALFSGLVLIEAVQLVIVLGLISSLVPVKLDPFDAGIFASYQNTIKPNRQMLIYHIFIGACLLAQASGIYAFRAELKDSAFQRRLGQWLCGEVFWVLLQCFAIFKTLIYKNQGWSWVLLGGALAVSVLGRIFWVELMQGWRRMQKYAGEHWNGHEVAAPLKAADVWPPLFVLVESIQTTIAFNWLIGRGQPVAPVWSYLVFIFSLGIFYRVFHSQAVRYVSTKPFIMAETLLTFFLLSSLYTMVIYDARPQLATAAFHVLLVLAAANKVFWPWVWSSLKVVWRFLIDPHNALALRWLADAGFAVFIVLAIDIPDPQAVLAKMYIGDEFIHTNCFIMAPGWAFIKGCLLDVDVMSRYGIGIPIVIASLAKWIGGYTYLNVFLVILWMCIVYYLLCYLFLRLWFKSVALAAAAILAGIKTELFYSLSFPNPMTYTSGTPARFWLDIVFMLLIWGHLKTRRWRYLVLAAACCGAAFFCVPETGLYLGFAFFGYVAAAALCSDLRARLYGTIADRLKMAGCALLVPGSAFLLLWGYLGNHLWDKQLSYNLSEISKLYTAGFWAGPWDGGLQYGQFWDLLIGLLFPLVYMATILAVSTLCCLRKMSVENLMAVAVSFYGLGSHHYYVVMATLNNYYPRGLPFIFIVFYWIGWLLKALPPSRRRPAAAAVSAFCAYCLWTNHHYLSYPNMFNFSRNPMVDPLVAERLPDGRYYFNHRYVNTPESLKMPVNSLGTRGEDLRTDPDFASDQELKDYYRQETDFSDDARLIRSLTGPDDPVPLLSSYETEMLMQADRKPFFYYFRVLQSRPLRMRSFPDADIWTTKELDKLIEQLDRQRPQYVFMERIFLQEPSPQQRAAYHPGLMGLLDYVKAHYRPAAQGKFLVAMQRKEI